MEPKPSPLRALRAGDQALSSPVRMRRLAFERAILFKVGVADTHATLGQLLRSIASAYEVACRTRPVHSYGGVAGGEVARSDELTAEAR
jgi:hypothetical protein